MSNARAIGWLLVIGLGFAFSRWFFGPSDVVAPADSQGEADAPMQTTSHEVKFDSAAEAAHLVKCVKWGPLQNQFRIRNPRTIMKLDRKLSAKRFPVLAFEVQAIEESPGQFFKAIYFDAEGVRLGEALVEFEPDYVTHIPDNPMTPPGQWPAGARSHAWIMLPEKLVNGKEASPIAKIVIALAF